MTFTQDLDKFSDHADRNMNTLVRLAVFQVGERLVNRTPVGNPKLWKANIGMTKKGVPVKIKKPIGYTGGRARANWQHGLSKKSGTIDKTDASGSATKGKIASSIPRKAAGKIHYISNNLPYIRALENGHSTQAPRGMVSLTVAEFPGIVNRIAGRLK